MEKRKIKMTEKKRLTISLASEVYDRLEEDAKKRGLNKSAYLTTLIQNFKEGE
jgi:predicted DNA-binding protein